MSHEPDLPYEIGEPGHGVLGETLVGFLLAGLGASFFATHIFAFRVGYGPGLGRALLDVSGQGEMVALLTGVVVLVGCLLLLRNPASPALMVIGFLFLPISVFLVLGPIYNPFSWIEWWGRVARAQGHKPAALAHPAGSFIGFLFVSGILLFLRAVFLARDGGATRGSARFANAREIRDLGLLEGKTGVVVGGEKGDRRPRYYYASERTHVGIFGPSGCGKTTKILIPSLLTDRNPAVVLDIKGELLALTGGYRVKGMGQKVFAWSPTTDPKQAGWVAGYNPLLDIPKGRREVSFADAIANSLVDPEGKRTSHDFWTGSAQALLKASILHVLYARKDKSLAGVEALLATADVRARCAQMLHTAHDPEKAQGWIDSETGEPTSVHPVVKAEAAKLVSLPKETFGGIVANARKTLSLFQDPIVAENTRRHSFSLRKVLDPSEPTTIYIVIPPNDVRLGPLLRLFLQQLGLFATDTLAAQQDSEGRLVAVGETSSRLTLYLDELTAVGRLDLVARGIAYLRGFGVQVVFAVQTLNQLLDVYSQYESLRGNVSYFVAFPSTEQRTAEDISRQLGKMTIRMEDEGLSSGESVFTRRRSTTQRDQERPLLMPDEVRRLGNHQPITMVTGAFPILNHLKGYYEFRELVEKTKIPVPALEPEEHESASVWRDTKALEPDLEQFRNLDDAGRPIRGPSKKETQEFREPEVDGADIDAY